jgi:formylglycine-generating enzyme required for sulfatase activity
MPCPYAPAGFFAARAAEPSMVFIPGGEFQRGRTFEWPDTALPWYPNPLKDDLPVRPIHVDPFYMDEAEVTNQRYDAFVKATSHRAPYYWPGGRIPNGKENHPVADVSWDDATAFCAWEGKRLPTEAEWERSCRGPADNSKYPWGDREPVAKDAHFRSNDGPVQVCSKEKSYFGLCDIIGNVWEWTADWYGRDYYKEAPDRNPKGPKEGIYRTLRGGSWFDQPGLFLACSYRSWARQEERSPTIGFRCVKDFGSNSK